jgi:hypothetical protein
MVGQIAEFQIKWENLDKKDEIRRNVNRCFETKFVYHSNDGSYTSKGVDSYLDTGIIPQSDLDDEGRSCINIHRARNRLLQEVAKIRDADEAKSLHGLLELGLVKEVNTIILEGVKPSEGCTIPGKISNKDRCTDYDGEVYYYADPDGLTDKVSALLDNYNDLIKYYVKREDNLKDKIYNMFKICGFLLFELLDLHPFSNGNGRLCRVLCDYILSSMTPFPTPIYNGWSESKKDDYFKALVDARKPESPRHPTILTTMIIESNYYAWKKLFEMASNGG